VADRARLLAGDWRQPGWTEPLGGPFDLVVSNPPYIASAAVPQLMPEVSSFEPRFALDGGADGFDAYHTIIAAGPRLVTAGGFVVVEVGEGQASEITRIFAAAGLSARPPWKDLGGIDRVVAAGN
jgi:release factor glutamine methyltransferase